MSLFVHELRMQQLVFWRNSESAVFVFVFPPMLFLLLGAVYDGRSTACPAADRLLVGILGYGCANTAFAGLAITLVIRREGGILKRLRATPLPPATYLAAVLVSTLIVFCLQMARDRRARRAALRRAGPGELGRARAGAAARRRRVRRARLRARVADPLGRGRVGGRQPRRAADGVPLRLVRPDAASTRDVLQAVADVLPLTYLIDLVEAAYLHGEPLADDPGAVAVVVAWGLAGLAVAARRFGWEPRER